jgi:hypothetical protein
MSKINRKTVSVSLSLLILAIAVSLISISDCHSRNMERANIGSNSHLSKSLRHLRKLDKNSKSQVNNLISSVSDDGHPSVVDEYASKPAVLSQKLTNKDLEKLKRDILIEGLKVKLLKLLDVDQVPNISSTGDINANPIPEPILREYNRLVKLGANKKRAGSVGLNGETRNSRSKSFEENENELQDEEMEAIRFNGSFVQQLTLLPSKCK